MILSVILGLKCILMYLFYLTFKYYTYVIYSTELKYNMYKLIDRKISLKVTLSLSGKQNKKPKLNYYCNFLILVSIFCFSINLLNVQCSLPCISVISVVWKSLFLSEKNSKCWHTKILGTNHSLIRVTDNRKLHYRAYNNWEK
jgi:hypothetical protein